MSWGLLIQFQLMEVMSYKVIVCEIKGYITPWGSLLQTIVQINSHTFLVSLFDFVDVLVWTSGKYFNQNCFIRSKPFHCFVQPLSLKHGPVRYQGNQQILEVTRSLRFDIVLQTLQAGWIMQAHNLKSNQQNTRDNSLIPVYIIYNYACDLHTLPNKALNFFLISCLWEFVLLLKILIRPASSVPKHRNWMDIVILNDMASVHCIVLT